MFTKVLVNGFCDEQTLVNLHNNFQGLIITPLGGLIYSLQWSYFNSKKESKEQIFRGKNHPRYSGVKITPKKEFSCT